MPNVLVISPTGALINGAERAGLSLMSHLVDLGFRIINAFPAHYKNHDPESFDAYGAAMQSAGIEQLPLDYGWWIPGDEAYAQREFAAVADIMSTVRENDIEAIISNTTNVPWGALAAGVTGRRHIWLLHEFPTGTFSWLEDKYDFVADFSSAVFCASPSLEATVRSRFARTRWPTPVHHFRPYSDVSSVTLAGRRAPRIVIVGSINRRKNQIEAVRMLPQLRAAGLLPSVLFVGGVEDEDYRTEIEQTARDLGVAEQLAFLGHRDTPWSVVSPMDIVLQCSETETFSLVACEAAKLGLRLILARNPSAIDIA
jgi:glycosyltransferase involved in cell wall biosynthesis